MSTNIVNSVDLYFEKLRELTEKAKIFTILFKSFLVEEADKGKVIHITNNSNGNIYLFKRIFTKDKIINNSLWSKRI